MKVRVGGVHDHGPCFVFKAHFSAKGNSQLFPGLLCTHTHTYTIASSNSCPFVLDTDPYPHLEGRWKVRKEYEKLNIFFIARVVSALRTAFISQRKKSITCNHAWWNENRTCTTQSKQPIRRICKRRNANAKKFDSLPPLLPNERYCKKKVTEKTKTNTEMKKRPMAVVFL